MTGTCACCGYEDEQKDEDVSQRHAGYLKYLVKTEEWIGKCQKHSSSAKQPAWSAYFFVMDRQAYELVYIYDIHETHKSGKYSKSGCHV